LASAAGESGADFANAKGVTLLIVSFMLLLGGSTSDHNVVLVFGFAKLKVTLTYFDVLSPSIELKSAVILHFYREPQRLAIPFRYPFALRQ
jgi:hypothetical protein